MADSAVEIASAEIAAARSGGAADVADAAGVVDADSCAAGVAAGIVKYGHSK